MWDCLQLSYKSDMCWALSLLIPSDPQKTDQKIWSVCEKYTCHYFSRSYCPNFDCWCVIDLKIVFDSLLSLSRFCKAKLTPSFFLFNGWFPIIVIVLFFHGCLIWFYHCLTPPLVFNGLHIFFSKKQLILMLHSWKQFVHHCLPNHETGGFLKWGVPPQIMNF